MTTTPRNIAPDHKHRHFLQFIMAFGLGIACARVVEWFVDTKRPAHDTMPELSLVRLVNINTKDRWIENYDLFVAPSEGIRSSSNYLLMVVIPKAGIPKDSLVASLEGRQKWQDGFCNFELSNGSPKGEFKPLLIDPPSLLKNPDHPALIFLDFIDDKIGGGPYVLRSRPP